MTDITPEALEALSKKATQGEWEWDAGIIPPDGPGRYSDIYIIDEDREPLTLAEFNDSIPQGRDNARFIVALVNAYRTGQLIPAPSADDAMVERVARSLAPFMEGGREYDQMPATRRELKIWSRNGMALINDATQDDAQEAANAAISAMQVKP